MLRRATGEQGGERARRPRRRPLPAAALLLALAVWFAVLLQGAVGVAGATTVLDPGVCRPQADVALYGSCDAAAPSLVTAAADAGPAPPALALADARGDGSFPATPAALALRSPRTWGISDQSPQTFQDSRFQALGIRHARLVVSWDVATNAAAGCVRERQRVAEWLTLLGLLAGEPLISFEKSRCGSSPTPAPRDYLAAVRAFRDWTVQIGAPPVDRFTAWNEPNLQLPGSGGAALAGRFFRALRQHCLHEAARACFVIAGDFADAPTLVTGRPGEESYLQAYADATGGSVSTWALHLYRSQHAFGAGAAQVARPRSAALFNAFRDATAAPVAGAVPQIWLTENGAWISKPASAALAAVANTPLQQCADARWLLDTIVNTTARVTRFYMYQWRGDVWARSGSRYTTLRAWDSGLVDAVANPDRSTDFTPVTDGSARGVRPVYQLFKAELAAQPLSCPAR